MAKPLCIYHGNCADGFTAAWAVWKRFGDTFEYHAGVYGQPAPDATNRDVVLVDFSYKREALRDLGRKARSILVLDHHKSAAEDLFEDTSTGSGPAVMRLDGEKWKGALTWERHLDNVTLDQSHGAPFANVYAYFDMERSGAGIAWDFFHPGTERPRLVRYVEDRDLWRFHLHNSRDINAYVFAHVYDFAAWDALANEVEQDPDGAHRAGAAIEKKHHKDVAELVVALKRDMVIGGHRVPVANMPYTLTSDAGNLMCSQWNGDMYEDGVSAAMPPFAACYWDTPKGRVFSLRSVGDFDVSAIAASYGGGGHKNASGFTLPHGVNP